MGARELTAACGRAFATMPVWVRVSIVIATAVLVAFVAIHVVTGGMGGLQH